MILCFKCLVCDCEWSEESDHIFNEGECPCCTHSTGELKKITNKFSLEVDWDKDEDVNEEIDFDNL